MVHHSRLDIGWLLKTFRLVVRGRWDNVVLRSPEAYSLFEGVRGRTCKGTEVHHVLATKPVLSPDGGGKNMATFQLGSSSSRCCRIMWKKNPFLVFLLHRTRIVWPAWWSAFGGSRNLFMVESRSAKLARGSRELVLRIMVCRWCVGVLSWFVRTRARGSVLVSFWCRRLRLVVVYCRIVRATSEHDLVSSLKINKFHLIYRLKTGVCKREKKSCTLIKCCFFFEF